MTFSQCLCCGKVVNSGICKHRIQSSTRNMDKSSSSKLFLHFFSKDVNYWALTAEWGIIQNMTNREKRYGWEAVWKCPSSLPLFLQTLPSTYHPPIVTSRGAGRELLFILKWWTRDKWLVESKNLGWFPVNMKYI